MNRENIIRKLELANESIDKQKSNITREYWKGYRDAIQYILDTLPIRKEKTKKPREGKYKIILETPYNTEEHFVRSLAQAEKIAARLTKKIKNSRAEIHRVSDH